VLPEEATYARYAEPGYLLFLRGGSLIAQSFNASNLRITGNAQTVAELVDDGQQSFSASRTGLLLYHQTSKRQLTWIDRDGNKLSTVGDPGYLSWPRIPPDGKYAIVADRRKNKAKLWLYDLKRGTANPFTFGEGEESYPSWSPDGQQVAFTSTRGGGQEDIYVKPVGGGSGEQLLLNTEGDKEVDAWSPDGRFLAFDYHGKQTKEFDVWMVPTFGERKPFPFIQGAANDVWATFSPDGKWVAYQSDESGRAELYVVPFPGLGGRWQISTGGALAPFWPPGKEIFYISADFKLMAVEFETQGTNFLVGKSRPIFSAHSRSFTDGGDLTWAGGRWLAALPADEPNVSPLILTTNWTAALKH
jgi:Tol biopolymer transport system component